MQSVELSVQIPKWLLGRIDKAAERCFTTRDQMLEGILRGWAQKPHPRRAVKGVRS